MMSCTPSVTHQHPLQAAQIVPLTLAVHQFLEADSVVQPDELLTDIYSLEETIFISTSMQQEIKKR